MRRLLLLFFSSFCLLAAANDLYPHRFDQRLHSASELDYPPLAVVTPEGKADGFSVELLKNVVRVMGGEVSFDVGAWAVIKARLEKGEIDVLPLVGRTPEREAYFDFTVPYLAMHGTVIVRKDDPRIKQPADLRDKALMVMQGDNAEEYLRRNGIGKAIIQYKSYEAALRALSKGEYDAVVIQKLVGIQLIKKLRLANLRPVDFILEDFRQDFSFAVREGNKALLALLNEGLAIVIADGTHARLYQKWLHDLEPSPGIDPRIMWGLSLAMLLLTAILVLSYFWQKTLARRVAEKTEALDELNATLEKRIAAATAALHEKEEMMIAQSRQAAMGEMIAMLAHQWRQPITVIAMAVNNIRLGIELEEPVTNDTLLKMTDTVTKQTQHLSQTIDDFRNFFKPNKEKEQTTVAAVLEGTMQIIGKSLENNNIAVTIDNRSETKLLTYPSELLQVFLNLLDNAKDVLKNTEDAHIDITISETENTVVATVCDNGGGIPEHVIHHIGEPYFTTKTKSGTGLGLYMSRTIVERHLGSTLAWENRDKGACFIITLYKE